VGKKVRCKERGGKFTFGRNRGKTRGDGEDNALERCDIENKKKVRRDQKKGKKKTERNYRTVQIERRARGGEKVKVRLGGSTGSTRGLRAWARKEVGRFGH